MTTDTQAGDALAGEVLETILAATAALYPEARIPETPMPTFSPGPWRAAHNGTCWQIDAESHAVATTQFCYAPETENNARLIAAAPELYAALDELFREGGSELIHEDYEPMLERARSALAKARGEP